MGVIKKKRLPTGASAGDWQVGWHAICPKEGAVLQTLKNKMLITAPHHFWARHQELSRTLEGRGWPFHRRGGVWGVPAGSQGQLLPKVALGNSPFPRPGSPAVIRSGAASWSLAG